MGTAIYPQLNKNKAPCRGCQERYLACHDHCERYQSWKKMWEAGKKKYGLTDAKYHEIETKISIKESLRRKGWR